MKETKKSFFSKYLDASCAQIDHNWAQLTQPYFDRAYLSNNIRILNNIPNLPKAEFAGVGSHPYLPIELFKSPQWNQVLVEDSAITFQSSGTGGSHSHVPFSTKGLQLYRETSVAYFQSHLETTRFTKGYSLIPPTSIWPVSSLAHMTAWISEQLPMEYVDVKHGSFLEEAPVWIFGTVAHLLALMQNHPTIKLHPDSIVIETGGSKNIQVTKPTFYKKLKQCFGEHIAIVSEYGMCELACQAYSTNDKHFQLPPWTESFIQNADGSFSKTGYGCLTIFDPSRIDCPLPIRTQDLVELTEDGFTYKKRLPAAPVKGCSLLAKDLIAPDIASSTETPTQNIVHTSREPLSINEIQTRTEHLTRECLALFRSDNFLKALTLEIGSLAAAQENIAYLLNNLEQTDWHTLLAEATSAQTTPKNWFFILPQNHSLAGMQHICVAYLADLACTIRIPRSFAHHESSLMQFLHVCKNLNGARIKLVHADFRLGATPLPPEIEALLCFGTDQTIADIQAHTEKPVKAFGSQLIGLEVHDFSSQSIDIVLREAFGLAQSGCLSTQVILSSAEAQQAQRETFYKKFKDFWPNDFDQYTQYHLQHSHANLQWRGFTLDPFMSHQILLPRCSARDLTAELIAYLLTLPSFCLPIIEQCSPTELESLRAMFTRKNLDIYPLQARPAYPKWSSAHNGQSLFGL